MIPWQKALKRLFDLVFSLAALILLAPFLLAVSLAVALESGGGAFFTQPRVGRGGRLFRIYKFRSMRPHPIDYQHLQEVEAGNPHLTPLGRRLRQYGIDELPQLLNILKGEMSFVGPRPTIQEQVDKYSPFQRRRLEVPPGLSGLAQVSGNTTLPWEERILLDVWYIDHWSLWLDARILLYSFLIVFQGQVMGQRVERPAYLPSLPEAQRHALHVE
jgi:lipopolysaccharide/colanic/teichoic acid biosynthesis glycosyltransferase